MKKFLFILFVFLILVTATIICINVFIDAGNHFKTSKFYFKLSETLLEKDSITSLYNIENTVLKKYMLLYFNEKLNFKPDIINLGSSRMWSLQEKSFPDKSYFNFSVPTIKVKDYMAIINFLEKKELFPETMILEIYPEIFSSFYRTISHPSLQDDYYNLASKIGIKIPEKEIKEAQNTNIKFFFQTLFSPQYTQLSLKYLLYNNNILNDNNINMNQDQNMTLYNFSIFRDGSVIPPNFIVNLKKDGKEYFFKALVKSIEKYTMDDNLKDYFEKIIKYLKDKKINTFIYLPPFSPQVYDSVKNYNNILSCEQFTDYLCKKYLIKKIGNYNPAEYNLNTHDYYDHVHIKYNHFYKIIEKDYNIIFQKELSSREEK